MQQEAIALGMRPRLSHYKSKANFLAIEAMDKYHIEKVGLSLAPKHFNSPQAMLIVIRTLRSTSRKRSALTRLTPPRIIADNC